MDDNEETREEFGTAITAMLETFGAEGTTPQLLGYWYALRDLSLEEVQQAVYEAMRTHKRRPMPAELRELVEGGSGSDRAIEAWGDVLKAVPRGPYKWIDFDDSLINAVIRNMGGWPAFLSRFADAESEKWVRLEFLKAYEAFASRRMDGDACDPLPGLSEVMLVGGKLMEPIPVRIGCAPERAKLSPPKTPEAKLRRHTKPMDRIGEAAKWPSPFTSPASPASPSTPP